MRRTAAFALILTGQHLLAQETDKILVGNLVRHWQRSKDLALAVAQAIPKDTYCVRVAPSQGSFGGLMNGIAGVNVLLCAMALDTPAPKRLQSVFDRPMDETKAGVAENLTVAYDYCIGGLEKLTDADLLQPNVAKGPGGVTKEGFKGRAATRLDIFWEAYARGIHLLGQAEVYLRLKGIKPPDTGPKFDF